MPIEIKELVIKVNVNGGGDNSQKKSLPSVDKTSSKGTAEMSALISEQVLDIIKRKEER